MQVKVFKTKKSFIKNLIALGETPEKAQEIFKAIAPKNKKDYHFELKIYDNEDKDAPKEDGFRDYFGDILVRNPDYKGEDNATKRKEGS